MSLDRFSVGLLGLLPGRSRAFALEASPPDAELFGLLELGELVATVDPEMAVALSQMTTPRVRALFNDQKVSFRTRDGLQFEADGGDIFAATIAAGHMPEARDYEAFMRLARPGSVVVDVGANFGLYALTVACYAAPMGRVFAFEAAPSAFAVLEGNVRRNKLDDIVTCTHAAVGAAAGRAKFFVAQDVSFSSLHQTARLGDCVESEVDVVSLTDALAHVRAVDLIKIDVEGAEAAVLEGAVPLLARSRGVIVQFEFSHKNLDEARQQGLAAVLGRLRQEGFNVYRRGASAAVELPSATEKFSGNLFLARSGDSEERLLRALAETDAPPPQSHELAMLALLRRTVTQAKELKRSEALQRQVIEIADSVVGEGVGAEASEAVRAVQRAWLDARRRAREAEGRADALTASVEGRDRLVEHSAEKIGSLRAAILALESRVGRVEEERDRLVAKVTAQRNQIAHIRERLEASQQRVAALQTSLRDGGSKAEQANARIATLRERLLETMAKVKEQSHELARVRNVSKRLRARHSALLEQLGEPDADGEPEEADEKAER